MWKAGQEKDVYLYCILLTKVKAFTSCTKILRYFENSFSLNQWLLDASGGTTAYILQIVRRRMLVYHHLSHKIQRSSLTLISSCYAMHGAIHQMHIKLIYIVLNYFLSCFICSKLCPSKYAAVHWALPDLTRYGPLHKIHIQVVQLLRFWQQAYVHESTSSLDRRFELHCQQDVFSKPLTPKIAIAWVRIIKVEKWGVATSG